MDTLQRLRDIGEWLRENHRRLCGLEKWLLGVGGRQLDAQQSLRDIAQRLKDVRQ